MGEKTCLVVDDSGVVRKILRRMIEALGLEVVEAADGKEALAQCDAHEPKVIMLDWNMPVMNGMEFLKAYFPKKQEKGTIVIFCTTENDTTKIMEAMEAGADEYIMKPFDEGIILAKFEQMGLVG